MLPRRPRRRRGPRRAWNCTGYVIHHPATYDKDIAQCMDCKEAIVKVDSIDTYLKHRWVSQLIVKEWP